MRSLGLLRHLEVIAIGPNTDSIARMPIFSEQFCKLLKHISFQWEHEWSWIPVPLGQDETGVEPLLAFIQVLSRVSAAQCWLMPPLCLGTSLQKISL